MGYETIIVERKGAVGVIRLNRPDKLNALNMKLGHEVGAALGEFEADEAVRAVVVTGTGDRAFAAGADIQEFAGKSPKDMWRDFGPSSMYNVVGRFPKPIIAAINGFALGGGCELAMACDIRIASEKAQLGQPEINLGIIPGGGGTQRLPRLVGLGKAMEMILTGDRIDARTAKDLGLVDEVVPPEELEKRALELASRIAEKAPVAVRLAKEAVKASARLPMEQGLERELDLISIAFSTEDKEEGVRAFLGKRPPQWKGR